MLGFWFFWLLKAPSDLFKIHLSMIPYFTEVNGLDISTLNVYWSFFIVAFILGIVDQADVLWEGTHPQADL